MNPKPRKLGFGLKGKKKKKVNTDLVLANKGAVDSDVEVPSEASSLPEGENTEDQPGSSGVVRTRVIPNYKRSKLKTRIQDNEGKPQSFQRPGSWWEKTSTPVW